MAALSRRSVLKGLAAVTGTGLFTSPTARALPRTLSRTRDLRPGVQLLPAGLPAPTHLGVSGGPARLRTRTAAGWGRWRTLDGCGGGRDADGRPASLTALPAGVLEYELDLPAAARVSELDVVSGPAGERVAPVAVEAPYPYLPRHVWGADESLRFTENGEDRYPQEHFPVQALTVHHTALTASSDPAADLRAIYYDHTVSRGWGDIGYHLLIDPAGQVYEGRYTGEDDVPVFAGRRSDGRPHVVSAAHVGGFNAGNIGVCLLGDLTSGIPSDAARRSLVTVLAALVEECGLDPLGRTEYVNPVGGATKAVDTISGHRDWNSTQCPGNSFYPYLPDVRAQVAKAR
ncbi:peptidoglycan recognition family protein [Lentzea sp. NPDC003310]|uniref:peptidoglycan recognition protein family protein n=1 Tax=Lentzea sp. NPDC003310 TaxID=3154447 RepID=UPI0033A33E47